MVLTIVGQNKLTNKIQSQILIVLLCMLNVLRPSSEVVREGRILKKIRHIQDQLRVSLWLARLINASHTTKLGVSILILL